MILALLALMAAPNVVPDGAIPSVATAEQNEADRLLAEAGHALRQGRFEQASTMVGLAVAAGANGSALDRVRADIAHMRRQDAAALQTYRRLLLETPNDPALLERGGISALRLGQTGEAEAMLTRAVAITPGRMPILGALAVLSDRKRDFAAANRYYAWALAQAPDDPRLLSNYGWSLILQGRWSDAMAPLERALAISPRFALAARNLELARSALDARLPQRREGESDSDFAARLNDAGVAAMARGEKVRAQAAFARALEISDQWYDRAARNLERLESR
ncbi:tetratricopeptide repeat protein [Sphingomicrobium marinum]|uniref:tetratricopeptide repeat protein n=1 Tax=Sphingomicrobium marinum TaxID=1227950 RepID=UPI00223EB886|nr:tetratricopeptide repeat protein [Sphingomicrobium marinum]